MLNFAVLTVSDRCSRGETVDTSGKVIVEIMEGIGARLMQYEIVPDEANLIKEKLIDYCDKLKADFVFTTGGTGFSPRDVTPEATLDVCGRLIPGIPELMRAQGAKITKRAYLSRGIAAIRKGTIIINLPGSPKGARESLEAILDIMPHALDMLKGGGH